MGASLRWLEIFIYICYPVLPSSWNRRCYLKQEYLFLSCSQMQIRLLNWIWVGLYSGININFSVNNMQSSRFSRTCFKFYFFTFLVTNLFILCSIPTELFKSVERKRFVRFFHVSKLGHIVIIQVETNLYFEIVLKLMISHFFMSYILVFFIVSIKLSLFYSFPLIYPFFRI